MSKKFSTVTDAFWALGQQHAKGKAEPKAHPQRLAVRSIKLWPDVFQHRNPAAHSSEAHVRELQRSAANTDLDPLTVWWDGKKWACIDGHHRLKAYMAANKGDHDVPVEVFSGTPEQAMAEAASRNTRDKLPMGRSEKTRTAWRLVLTTTLSKARIVLASGASDGIVGAMRRTKKHLEGRNVILGAMSWEEARRMAAGEEAQQVDWDARNEQEAQDMANTLVKALGKRASTRLEAFARALEIYDTRLPSQLAEFWSGQEEEDAGAEVD